MDAKLQLAGQWFNRTEDLLFVLPWPRWRTRGRFCALLASVGRVRRQREGGGIYGQLAVDGFDSILATDGAVTQPRTTVERADTSVGIDARQHVRILVITGIRLYRDGLAEVLGRLPGVESVVTADDGAAGLSVAHRTDPHIVLLDMSVLDCSDTVRRLVRDRPGVKVVALGVPETGPHVLACAAAGVSGYVPRDGSLDDLVLTLRHVIRDEALCSPRIAASLMHHVAVLSLRPEADPVARLTDREREILQLIARGLGNREIARHLGIQLCTVKNHVHNLLEKLGAADRAEAATIAQRLH